MAGWSIWATTWASRWKRCSASGVKRLGGISLIATSRLSSGSRARYTTPMPPRPSSPVISYRLERRCPTIGRRSYRESLDRATNRGIPRLSREVAASTSVADVERCEARNTRLHDDPDLDAEAFLVASGVEVDGRLRGDAALELVRQQRRSLRIVGLDVNRSSELTLVALAVVSDCLLELGERQRRASLQSDCLVGPRVVLRENRIREALQHRVDWRVALCCGGRRRRRGLLAPATGESDQEHRAEAEAEQ